MRGHPPRLTSVERQVRVPRHGRHPPHVAEQLFIRRCVGRRAVNHPGFKGGDELIVSGHFFVDGFGHRFRILLRQRRTAVAATHLLVTLDAKPLQDRRHVVDDLLRGVGLARQVGHHLEEEVPALVQEGREVGVFVQRDQQLLGVERAARALLQDVGVGRIERTAVAGGALDLLGVEGDVLRAPLPAVQNVAEDHPVVPELQRVIDEVREGDPAVRPVVVVLGVGALDDQGVLQRQVHRHDVGAVALPRVAGGVVRGCLEEEPRLAGALPA